MEAEIVMLGTGSAFPRKSYNECFAVRCNDFCLLVDGGGGNGIFQVLERSGIDPADISHVFVSHSHTDHILGIVWLLRRLVNFALEGKYEGEINVYANAMTTHALTEICRLTFLETYFDKLHEIVRINTVDNGSLIKLGTSTLSFFDVGSENVEQTGFRLTFPSQKTIVALGDEALTEKNCRFAVDADYLICGAFCRYADREKFRPYEKHHYTVKDVAGIAEKIDVRNLILVHSEDSTKDRGKAYKEEASAYFSGNIIIPADGDIIRI